MSKSTELKYIDELFYVLGREEKMSILKKSNLTEIEYAFMCERYVKGLQRKEMASTFNLSVDGVDKCVNRISKKLYLWISRDKQRVLNLIDI